MILGFIILLAIILRLINLNQSLWLDEAISVLAAKNNSFWAMTTEYVKYDFHPPLYFAVLWIWTKIFGFSEIAVRLPSLIFGVSTVILVYYIGGKLHSKTLGFIAALLLTINPLHIYYSQEARMYMLAATASSLCFFFFIKLLKNENINIFVLILGNLAVLLSDYLAYFIFPAQFLIILFQKKIQIIKKWLLSLVISFSFLIWWIPIFLSQVGIGIETSADIPGWKMVVGDFGIKSLILTYVKFIIGRISHPDNLIYVSLFLPVGLLFIFIIWQATNSSNKLSRIVIISWTGIPIILGWLFSLIVPVYSYFRMLFVLPAFVLLIALGILKFKSKVKYFLFISIATIEIISASFYLFNPKSHREDWKGLTSFLKTKQQNVKILFESNGSFAPFDYYADNQIKGRGALENFPAKSIEDLIDLKTELNNISDIYLIDYLVEISDPQRLVTQSLDDLEYKLLDIKNFNGVGFVYHYTK